MTSAPILSRACAAALALAAIQLAAPSASAAVTAQHFQALSTQITCNAGCVLKFPKLAANRSLDIDHIVCDIYTGGNIVGASVKIVGVAPTFYYPLGLQWERPSIGTTGYTLGGEVNIRVPYGKQVVVEALISGSPAGTCSITGTLYIQS